MFKSWLYWIFSALALTAVFFALNFIFAKTAARNTDKDVGDGQVVVSRQEEYPDIAQQIAERITEISPTPPFGENGWIAYKILFVSGSNLAYVEYTDTHVALKLLLEYHYQSQKLVSSKVLATFIPREQGQWVVDQGSDEARNLGVTEYVFNGDTEDWVTVEASSNNNTN